jgi:hypothetical protein
MTRTLPTPPTLQWPQAQMHAARVCGRLSALGLAEGPPLLKHIYRAARKASPDLDPSGLKMRLVWSAREGQQAVQRERAEAENAIWRALQPALARRAPGPELLAVAQAQNPGDPPALRQDEVQAIVERAIHVHLAKLKKGAA